MHIPPIITPATLVPEGAELDATREVSCICGNKTILGRVNLVWADFGDGWGWRAVCSPQCYTCCFKEGEA